MLAIVLLLILPWVNSFVLKKENGEKGTLQRLITFTCNWTTSLITISIRGGFVHK